MPASSRPGKDRRNHSTVCERLGAQIWISASSSATLPGPLEAPEMGTTSGSRTRTTRRRSRATRSAWNRSSGCSTMSASRRVADASAESSRLCARDGLDALGLVGPLAKFGGHGASPSPPPRRAGEREQRVERAGVLVDRALGSPTVCAAAPGTVSSGSSAGSTSATSSHERHRDARVGRRPDRPGGGDGAVAGVLVVVDEDAVALLLPPLARRQPGMRRSTSRASASAARRTSAKPCSGTMRTLM